MKNSEEKGSASLAGAVLSLCVESHQLEEDKDHVLIVIFEFLDQFIRGIGEEGLQTRNEALGVARLNVTDKRLYLKGGTAARYGNATEVK